MWNIKLNRKGVRPSKPRAKRPPLLVYVMYLLVATVVFTGVTFSSYISTTSGQDSARVAKFDIKGSGTQAIEIAAGAMIPGDSFTKQFTIQNSSEVAVELTITAEMMYHKLPLQLTIDSVENQLISTLPVGSAEQTYTLTVSWPSTANDITWAGKADVIHLTINAQQID